MQKRSFWTLNKLMVLLVMGAFAGLLLEIRYTHRDVLGEEPLSWTPLIYSGLMLLVGVVALLTWERGGRKAMFWGFALGLIVGPLGLWLHTLNHPVRGVERELSAWTMPIKSGAAKDAAKPEKGAKSKGSDKKDASKPEGNKPKDGGDKGGGALDAPPVLAPLSFFGLALMGMVACAKRFQPEERRGEI